MTRFEPLCICMAAFFKKQEHFELPVRLTDRTRHDAERRGRDPMWNEMYEEFWDKLEHFCVRLCRDESRAEDLTQEVFLKALMNRSLIESFNARQCKAWLFATARNLYCDQVRRAAKERELMEALLPDGDEEPADETASAAVGLSDLESLMGILEPADRMLFELRYGEGYNASELGEMLKLPPGTVRTRLLKIRTKLKDELLEE